MSVRKFQKLRDRYTITFNKTNLYKNSFFMLIYVFTYIYLKMKRLCWHNFSSSSDKYFLLFHLFSYVFSPFLCIAFPFFSFYFFLSIPNSFSSIFPYFLTFSFLSSLFFVFFFILFLPPEWVIKNEKFYIFNHRIVVFNIIHEINKNELNFKTTFIFYFFRKLFRYRDNVGGPEYSKNGNFVKKLSKLVQSKYFFFFFF